MHKSYHQMQTNELQQNSIGKLLCLGFLASTIYCFFVSDGNYILQTMHKIVISLDYLKEIICIVFVLNILLTFLLNILTECKNVSLTAIEVGFLYNKMCM